MKDAVVLVDAHVHVYPNFNVARLLSCAAANFARHAMVHSLENAAWQGVLLLAETHSCDWFARTRAAGVSKFDTWTVSPALGDDISLLASSPGQKDLVVVAGRQVNSREGIEVLTLANDCRVADGLPLRETIQRGIGANAVVVLPWGVGKWLGRRGGLVREAMRGVEPIFSGDNSARPWFWPRPAAFAVGEERGRPVLPGTDPLPLPGEESRVGSCGFAMRGALGETNPGVELRDRLLGAATTSLQPFGARERLHTFALNQIKLRLAG